MPFETKEIGPTPDKTAPDGSKVHILCKLGRGSMAAFTLTMGEVARAVAHRTVEEIWYVASGNGRIWRKSRDQEAVTILVPGVSLSIPVGTQFQFRCDGVEPLRIVAVTMPPWPGETEAYPVAGRWKATPV